MLLTTEWDLHDLLRDLRERMLLEAQHEHGGFNDFLEMVREEESVALWFGAEDRRGRGAKFELCVRHDGVTDAAMLTLMVDGTPFDLYRFNTAPVDGLTREWAAAMGPMRKDSLKGLFEHLVRTGDLDQFFYVVRTTAPEDE